MQKLHRVASTEHAALKAGRSSSASSTEIGENADELSDTSLGRWWLYVPRNLSHCSLCQGELAKHVKRKTEQLDRLLANRHHHDLFEARHEGDGAVPVRFFLPQRASSRESSAETPDDCAETPPYEALLRPRSMSVRAVQKTSDCSLLDNKLQIRRRKKVRFADALGLELERVRFIMSAGFEPPVTHSHSHALEPRAPTAEQPDSASVHQVGSLSRLPARLEAAFTLPPRCAEFDGSRGSVYLEEIYLTADFTLAVCGRVRVQNLAYQKLVWLRCSVDGWRSYRNHVCAYIPGSSDGRSDAFGFTVFLPRSFGVGGALHFAVCLESDGRRLWDNNGGRNYTLNCVGAAAANQPRPIPTHSWIHSL